MTDKYSYQITKRAADLGGGWNLLLLKNDEEEGRGVYQDGEYGEALDEGEAWVESNKPTEPHGPPHGIGETLKTVLLLLQAVEPIISKFPRDKTAIELAKAMLANPPYATKIGPEYTLRVTGVGIDQITTTREHQVIDIESITATAVQLADALAKQLQVTAPAPASQETTQ